MKKLLHFILAVLMVIGIFHVPVKAAGVCDVTFVISEGSLGGRSGTFTEEIVDNEPIGPQLFPYSYETVVVDAKDHGFAGWSLTPNGGICYSNEEMWSLIPSEDMTLYAVYNKAHTVTFNFGKGHWGERKTLEVQVVEGVLYDFSYIVPEIDDPNLAFGNWRFGSGKVAPYSFELTDFTFSQDLTINAEYDVACNLTLNATEGYMYENGKKVPSVTYKVAKGYPAQIDAFIYNTNPSKVISDWEDAGHKSYNETDPRYLRVNEDTTLYACWDYVYPVTSFEMEEYPTVDIYDEVYLPITITPYDATYFDIFVESNNAMVVSAAVDGYGVRLYGRTDGMGKVTVRILNGDDSVVSKTINVYVKADGDPAACKVFGFCWYKGKQYWYEGGIRQAVMGDPKNIIDTVYGYERGREIYDPDTDGWYWLDCIYDGAKAQSKEVWMPYIYQEDFAKGINKEGKWVRYDDKGKMIKGWYTVQGSDISLYPAQAGNTYYYDLITGEMCKGNKIIEGKTYYFDENTGVLKQ